MSPVTFDNTTLLAGERRVFENFSWRIGEDEHWVVTGPTGSGKTLLAAALCRRIPLVSGSILFDFNGEPRPWLNRNEVIRISTEDQSAFLRRYASCHQSRWMSLDEEDVPTVAELLSRRSIEHHSPFIITPDDGQDGAFLKRQEEAVALLEIGHLLERRVIQLSNGETRKLLLARALITGPRILVLDDPFGGLDPDAREHLKRILDTILSENRTGIILMTPREDEIPNGITHRLRVDGCRAIESGPIRHSEYNNSHSAGDETITSPAGDFPVNGWHSIPPGEPLLELNDVSVVYGNTRILDRISWTMHAGEHWALLGHNGAGKSTLISLFLGDNPQVYANDVRVFGIRRGSGENTADLKARIGWMSPELLAHYDNSTTCREVVLSGLFESVGLYRKCTEEQKGLASLWLEALGIAAHAGKPLRSLSAGEQRLVFLARALVKQPAVLILDEPLQGLDRVHREHIRTLLDRLCRETPVSLLIVTHHAEELPEAVTRRLVLERGMIIS